MKNLLMLSDPGSSILSAARRRRRRRSLPSFHRSKSSNSILNKQAAATPAVRKSRTPSPSTTSPSTSSSTTTPSEPTLSSASSSNGSSNRNRSTLRPHLVTTTSCHDRLHLVVSRRSPAQRDELAREMDAHANAKAVYIYTDSPLSARAPVSAHQQRDLLLRVANVCTKATTLHLDFSSEFGPTSGDVSLSCDLLAMVLNQAPQLETLWLKDVPLSGTVQELTKALHVHPNLKSVELKWCTDVVANPDNDISSPRILPTLVQALAELPHLQELTVLAECGSQLPLQPLATSSSIQKLTLALEQRHATWQTVADRQEEQMELLEFLNLLPTNTTLTHLCLFAHHWKAGLFGQHIRKLMQSDSSCITHLEITDYSYGSDDPLQLMEWAAALKHHPRMQHFKIHSKKSSSIAKAPSTSSTDASDAATPSQPNAAANTSVIDIYQAFVEMAQANTILESLEIVHAGISLVPCHPHHHNSSLDSSRTTTTTTTTRRLSMTRQHQWDCLHQVHFYLQANHNGARHQLLAPNFQLHHWMDFLNRSAHNTALVFYFLQSNPNLLLSSRQSAVFES
jgi:hypothetical protein